MPLPSHVRVKLSSEAAGTISLTPVVIREMPLRELVEELLAVMGKDAARVHSTLARGSFISGASRFRWEPLQAREGETAELLASFPDPDPSRIFDAASCVSALLRVGRAEIELVRETAVRARLFRKENFWDALMRACAAAAPRYHQYSYRHRADHFRLEFTREQMAELQRAARLLRYPDLRARLARDPATGAEVFLSR